jgi:hypothetical protein
MTWVRQSIRSCECLERTFSQTAEQLTPFIITIDHIFVDHTFKDT